MNEKRYIPAWLEWPQTQVLIKAFARREGSLRFVGGAVRDGLIGRPVQDVDAAAILPPDEVMALLAQDHIRAIPTGIAHGTVTAVIEGKHFEITTLRRDVACDGRHAQVSYTADWKEDASRRDFTINAMYLSPEGELFDYFDGQDDLRHGAVRFIGDAGARITEDYLRILRYFRFYAYYGHIEGKWVTPDAQALAACQEYAPKMASLSGERIQHEMFKLMSAPVASETLRIMHDHKILPHVLGFGISDCTMFLRFETIARVAQVFVPPIVKLSAFVLRTDIAEENALTKFARRLKLSNFAEKTLEMVLRHCRDIHVNLNEAELKHLIRRLGAENFRMSVVAAWAHGKENISTDHPYCRMIRMAQEWVAPVFPLSGNDLIERGVKPGKALGDTLRRLEEEWEISGYTLTRDELMARLLR